MDKEGVKFALRFAIPNFKDAKRSGTPVSSELSAGMLKLCDAFNHAMDDKRRTHAKRMFDDAAKAMVAAADAESKRFGADMSLIYLVLGCVWLCNAIRDLAVSE